MEVYSFQKVTKAMVDALKECIDLCTNGYMIQHSTFIDEFWFIKLKHKRNGRILCIKAYKFRWEITEKGLPLKHQDYQADTKRYQLAFISHHEEVIDNVIVDGHVTKVNRMF